MRNILFEPRPPLPCTTGLPMETPPPFSRRLLAITIALQLSGAPPPDTATQLLLARYVAGRISLAQLLPLLWQG